LNLQTAIISNYISFPISIANLHNL